jgi:hypothetical protein
MIAYKNTNQDLLIIAIIVEMKEIASLNWLAQNFDLQVKNIRDVGNRLIRMSELKSISRLTEYSCNTGLEV